MKSLAALISFFALAPALLAQTPGTNTSTTNSAAVAPVRIAATDAKDHLGSPVVVSGKVAEVNIAERLVRLNLEKAFPNQAMTAVIFASKTNLFTNLAGLKDKTVEILGTIADYHGRPEIVLTNAQQLRVLDQAAAPPARGAK